MEYASNAWITASKTCKAKLDKVQNLSLRIIHGALKSTPVKITEKTADLPPLEKRRELKVLAQGEKMKRLPAHPLHDKLKEEPMNRLKRRSINHVIKDLQLQHQEILPDSMESVESLRITPWSPQKRTLQIRKTVPGIELKATQSAEVQRVLTLEMLDCTYPSSTWTRVYTDGSAQDATKNGGSGALLKHPDDTAQTISVPAGALCTNYRAEVHALTAATDCLIKSNKKKTATVLLTDSLSALQSLESGKADPLTCKLMENLHILDRSRKIVLQWIPAHVGIVGNETADQLAREGSKLQQPEVRINYEESKTLLKRDFKTQWTASNDGYSPAADSISKLERKQQVEIFRLRTGHCRLKKHLKRVGLSSTAVCECGLGEQTPEHILEDCPLADRTEAWPQDTTYHQKLWGTEAELLCTTAFLGKNKIQV